MRNKAGSAVKLRGVKSRELLKFEGEHKSSSVLVVEKFIGTLCYDLDLAKL
jgi:hypothetical protein